MLSEAQFKVPDGCRNCKFAVDLFENGGLFCRGFDPNSKSWFVCGLKNLKNDCKDFKEK